MSDTNDMQAPARPAHGAPPLVRLVDVHKSFGHTPILAGVSLEVQRGEVVVFVGRSGSGKTTLIRCINGLETIDGGRIYADGELISHREHRGRLKPQNEITMARHRERIGMVFQRFNLFPNLTALENVMIGPLRVQHRARAEVREEALDLLDKVGLAEKVGHYPAQLSGGQQQRVAIARALAMKPMLMLFDEPTSALDPETIDEVLAVMRALAAEGMTMIVVTHEMRFARDVADRIVTIEHGRIIDESAPDIYFNRTRSNGLSVLTPVTTPIANGLHRAIPLGIKP
jgi:polar amino acid transport system ATP-binding protein